MFIWDWKESPGEVMRDLAPLFKKLGVHVYEGESSSDSFSYILSKEPLSKKDRLKFEAEVFGVDQE